MTVLPTASASPNRSFFSAFLTSEDASDTHAAAARDLGATEGAVKVAVHRLRSRYREALHAAVAATVASEEDVADEIAYCLRVLAGP